MHGLSECTDLSALFNVQLEQLRHYTVYVLVKRNVGEELQASIYDKFAIIPRY